MARRGVTLIEIVVVLGILGFLAAFLAPFLFQVRVRAGRTQGINNLKQLGLSVHAYSDTFTRMPAIAAKGPDGRPGSILYHILPFIEQQALYNRGPAWQANTIGVTIPTYLDPTDPSAPPGNKFQDWLATSSYAANWLAFTNDPKGIPAAFPDGTSNTIIFTQRYQVCNDTPCAWAYDKLYYWAPMTAYYSFGKFQVAPTGRDCNPALPQTFDQNSIAVGMGDGSVLTVSTRVSPQTWHHALTPDGGEPMGADFND